MRWGRFWGLGFAPENGAREAKSKAPQPPPSGCCRLFAQHDFGLAARLLKARKPCGGPEFAIGLIAAKPVKPCDGGIFGALDSLLKTEHKKRNSKQHRRDRLAAVAWLRLSGCTDWHWRCGAIAEKLIAVRRVERRFFRSWFNSAKSRQTVRWGRFWGLEFAPEKRAPGVKSSAAVAVWPLPFVHRRLFAVCSPFGRAARLGFCSAAAQRAATRAAMRFSLSL